MDGAVLGTDCWRSLGKPFMSPGSQRDTELAKVNLTHELSHESAHENACESVDKVAQESVHVDYFSLCFIMMKFTESPRECSRELQQCSREFRQCSRKCTRNGLVGVHLACFYLLFSFVLCLGKLTNLSSQPWKRDRDLKRMQSGHFSGKN